MITPLVSVVIPIYNRFDLANQAVDSVVSQTYRPIELILVDDNSEKPYPSITQLFNSPDFVVKLIRNKQNIGPGLSRQAGLDNAKGKYIAFLDSDDLWHPRKIESQVQLMEQDQEIGMSYCITSEFQSLPITGLEPIRNLSNNKYDSIFPILFYGRPWSTSSCLWNRRVIDKYCRWSDSTTWEDYEFDFVYGCQEIPIGYIKEVFCYKRSIPGSGQLSNIDERSSTIQKSKPIIRMFECAQSSSLWNQSGFREIFINKIIKKYIIKLLKYEEYRTVGVLIPILFKSSNLNNLIFGLLIKNMIAFPVITHWFLWVYAFTRSR